MIEFGKKAAIDKKAYEIAYALFRIAAKIAHAGIREKLTDAATNVLASAVAEEYGNVEKYLEVVDYLVKLSTDVDSISFINGDVLIGEIGNLKTMIAECVHTANNPVDISEFFSSAVSATSVIPAEAGIRASVIPSSARDPEISPSPRSSSGEAGKARNDVHKKLEPESGNNPANAFLKSGMRQIAILDKIRQSGNCRLKDIQEVLPDASERTIRYDLEDLIERNLIERVGAGGPAVSYKMRQL